MKCINQSLVKSLVLAILLCCSFSTAVFAQSHTRKRTATSKSTVSKQTNATNKQENLQNIPTWLNGKFGRSYVTMPDRLEDMEQIMEVYYFDRRNRTCYLTVYNNKKGEKKGETKKFYVENKTIYADGNPILDIYESDFLQPFLTVHNNFSKKYGRVD